MTLLELILFVLLVVFFGKLCLPYSIKFYKWFIKTFGENKNER
jgi:hypothetical protein